MPLGAAGPAGIRRSLPGALATVALTAPGSGAGDSRDTPPWLP